MYMWPLATDVGVKNLCQKPQALLSIESESDYVPCILDKIVQVPL